MTEFADERAQKCKRYLEDFNDEQCGKVCTTCAALGVSCLGGSHPHREASTGHLTVSPTDLGEMASAIMAFHKNYMYPNLHIFANVGYFAAYLTSITYPKPAHWIGCGSSVCALLREEQPVQGIVVLIAWVCHTFGVCVESIHFFFTWLLRWFSRTWRAAGTYIQALGEER